MLIFDGLFYGHKQAAMGFWKELFIEDDATSTLQSFENECEISGG